jgi:hypothetical protein
MYTLRASRVKPAMSHASPPPRSNMLPAPANKSRGCKLPIVWRIPVLFRIIRSLSTERRRVKKRAPHPLDMMAPLDEEVRNALPPHSTTVRYQGLLETNT